MTTWLLMTVGAVLVQLLVTECFDWLPWLSRRILHAASLHVPREHRADYEDAWLAELEVIPGLRFSRLLFCLRVLSRAPALRREIGPGTGLYFSTPAKRLIDLIAASLAVALFLPVFVVISLAIKLTSPGPVFSREERLGFEGTTFDFIRFRTTASLVGSAKLAARPSTLRPVGVTGVGQLLRRFSLDELPQFFNVMKGDMSLVGPRALLVEEAKYLEGWHSARCAVRPGISGLWQISTDGRLSFDDMIRLDLRYVQGWSLSSDVRILLGTVKAVLASRPV